MTKRELLITGLAVGVLGLLAGFAVLSARSQTRDITRLAQVREVQTGLELFFQDHSAYPVAAEPTALGQGLTACLGEDGFSAPCGANAPTPYLSSVPTPPSTGLDGESSCSGVKNAFCYQGATEGYRIQFELERANRALGVQSGVNCATELGFEPGPCSSLSPAVE